MAYDERCSNEGFSCEWLLRFSNPDQSYLGDPLGLPADSAATKLDGPADARLTLNNTARWVSSFRSEACTDFTVTPESHVVSAAGGRVVVNVDTAPGCLWETSNPLNYVLAAFEARTAGSGSAVLEVGANQSGEERSGTVTVAGRAIIVRQLATTAGVCGRTSGVFQAITHAAGFADAARCDEVTDSALAGIASLDLRNKGLDSLQSGDFAGMSGLQTLHLNQNELTDLPEGLFAGLSSLHSLYISGNTLIDVPSGLFAGLSSLLTLNLESNRLTDLPAGIFTGLSKLRTLQLANNRLTDWPAALLIGLSDIRTLDLSRNRLKTITAGTFSGLPMLESLHLGYNGFAFLPDSLFDGLSNLQRLNLYSNQFSSLPVGLFKDLGNLQSLWLGNNDLTDLANGLFNGLSNLSQLILEFNQISQLPLGIFAGLTSLEDLRLNNNRFRDLSRGLFDSLPSLSVLDLRGNLFVRLPNHLFSGLPALPRLYLTGNTSDPLPLPVTLEKVGEDQFKAVVPTGAPFALVLPISISGGAIEGDMSSVTIPATEEESAPIGVMRRAGVLDAVTVDIGTLPGLPSGHEGYALEKGASLPLEILQAHATRDVALTGLSVDLWTLDPAFAPETTEYAAIVDNETSSITVTVTRRHAGATLQFLDGKDNELADTDAAAEGHQASLSPGLNTIKVKITAEAGTTARIYTLVLTRDGASGVCGRTKQVRDEIVRVLQNVDVCHDVTEEHLSTIQSLLISDGRIASLQSGDFEGLTAIEHLLLHGNQLNSLPDGLFSGLLSLRVLWLSHNRLADLPADIFSGLTALETLLLWRNELNSLPDGLFTGLTSLQFLGLDANQLSGLPANIFSGLPALTQIGLGDNQLADLPADIFSGLTTLKALGLAGNQFSSLPADLFSGLTSLESIDLYDLPLNDLPTGIFSGLPALKYFNLGRSQMRGLPADVFSELFALEILELHDNPFGSLPADIFSGLRSLRVLWLPDNRLRNLPDGIFSGLTALERLGLQGNRLSSLPADVFSGLIALEELRLDSNKLRDLPDGIFSDLSSLGELHLQDNAVEPLLLPLSLEKGGDSQFKAVAPTGAPFSLVLPVSISSAGEIEGGARTVTIPAGAVESAPLKVAREAGTDYAVTVDLGTLPALPARHRGYVLEKDETLPREILPGPRAPPPGQVTGVEIAAGAEQLEVSWTSVSDAGGYKVQWKSGEEAYDESRQAVIIGGDAISYTIAELTAGTEYTIRVIATKDNADDGPPSNEVTGIPTPISLSQVTGVEVTAGTEQLEVSWTTVSDADGYKVQWKSGEDAYDESRLAVIIGGDAISYTIAELTAGTEYTVRVVATKDNAEDGPPSSEVTGIPKSSPPAPVTGVEVTTGVEQLDVSWTAVADASGYKVQWKSGEEAYDESRQAVIPSGDTISYTIAGLSGGAEYTIRVLATKDNADDGPPSSEVTGIPAFRPTDAMLISLSMSDGALDPAFAADTTRYVALVANVVSSLTVTPVTSHPDATVAYLDAGDQPLADADATTDGHQVNLREGKNTIQVKVTSEDGTATRTYTLVVTRRGATDVCVRTAQVRDTIMAAISGVDACADVTEAHLSGIMDLNLRDANISSLQRGDFDGLTALESLDLLGNQLSGLPAGLFSELPTLRRLELGINRLVSVPEDAFSGLPLLERLNLGTNQLSGLPSGLFSGLSALKELYLDQNRLSDLPEAVFSGLSALRILHLYSNTVDPLPLFVSLEKVGSSQFKAVAPTGAPFTLVLPVSISSAGEIEGGARTVTIPAGAVESAPLQVVREVGTEAAVTVDLGTLPALPGSHIGYVLEKDDTLPREILSGPGALPPAQVTGVEVLVGVEQLAVSWTAVSDAGGYNVQWKSGEEAYDESRQAMVASGDTVSHTIAGLTAGTEYTVRVLATKDNADEGPASIEVIGVPTATQAGPVTGVEITAGVGQLAVSWTAVSDAGGYKVQWKSGQEAYDEVRQAVIVDSDTVSHTITELSAGTEYTVRVLATEDNADDGPPSNEVTGIPTSVSLSQVMGVEVAAGVEQLDVSWTVVSDAGGYKVQWKSGEEAYDESRQASVASGDRVSHTIAGLTAGTEYTIRIIATKEHADDGEPSSEVIGTPKALPPAPVTGVEVTAGVEQLDVSWTEVADAGGYKVQWKSGEEAYDEARQASIAGGNMVSHTIRELTAGTEYTVRVIATREHADDGEPSSEVMGIPKAEPPAPVTGVEITAGVEQLDVSWTAVADAGGYKVQWKSGEQEYDEARQAVIPDGDTVHYTIPDLTADTQYTVRVMATKDNADDGLPSAEVMATPTAVDPDVNGDGLLNGDDALVMYHAYASASQLGDGETGGTAASRQTLLSGLAGLANPSDEELKAMIRKAHGWRESGVDAGGDINEDGEIDGEDAFVMYYAYELDELVGDGETGGTVRFRQLLLAAFANQPNPSDEDLKAMLRRANALRDDFG